MHRTHLVIRFVVVTLLIGIPGISLSNPNSQELMRVLGIKKNPQVSYSGTVYEDFRMPGKPGKEKQRLPGGRSDRGYLSQHELSHCRENSDLYLHFRDSEFKLSCDEFLDSLISKRDHLPKKYGSKENPIPSQSFTAKLNTDPNVTVGAVVLFRIIDKTNPSDATDKVNLILSSEECVEQHGFLKCPDPGFPDRPQWYFVSSNENEVLRGTGARFHIWCQEMSNVCQIRDVAIASDKIYLEILYSFDRDPRTGSAYEWYTRGYDKLMSWVVKE